MPIGLTGDCRTDQRISINPVVHHGDPCIAGTRVPVSVIGGSSAEGDTIDQVLVAHPQLAREEVRAALRYPAEAVNRFDFISAP